MDALIVEWRKMSLGGKVARSVSWVLYGVLAVVALRDLGGRGPEKIRGKKWMWMAAMAPVASVYGFALPVAELMYFLIGRKK